MHPEALTPRKQAELVFHNERFRSGESDGRAALDRWYVAIESGSRKQLELIARYGRGKSVLEYGCADGEFSLIEHDIARIAGQFAGIDLSDCAIARAVTRSEALDQRKCRFEVMDAESMTFPNDSFDLVFGRGVIHHLNLDRAFLEVRRVLRPGGCAVFYEPLGHNPVINLFRQRTPALRTPDEHPLVLPDFALARRHFDQVSLQYFGLTTLGAAVLPQGAFRRHAVRACESLDNVLLRVPVLNRNAWFVLATLR